MYRAHFNASAEDNIALELRRAENALDANITHAVSMGNLEVEGSSVNGRRATGSAVTAETFNAKQERKKKEASLIAIIQQFHETLHRMDERMEQLTVEINQLSDQRAAEEARSDVAFAQMHDLESQLEDIEGNGFTDYNRETLRRSIGQVASEIDNDEALIECTRDCIIQEQKNGIEAHTEAQILDDAIAEKIRAKDALIEAREEIENHPTASLTEKTALAEAALAYSMSGTAVDAERARGNDTNQAIEKTLDSRGQELTSEDNFEFNKNSLTPSVQDLNDLNF